MTDKSWAICHAAVRGNEPFMEDHLFIVSMKTSQKAWNKNKDRRRIKMSLTTLKLSQNKQ